LCRNIKYLSLPLAKKTDGARDKPSYVQLQGGLMLLSLSQELPMDTSQAKTTDVKFEPDFAILQSQYS
jgi:hypothetical protein